MATVTLYAGSLRLAEREVGRLVDGQVEVGQYSSTTYPAHVDEQGAVVSGAKFSPAFEQRTLGKVSDDGRTIVRGYDPRGEPVGTFDPDGTVYVGTGFDRRIVGRTDPPSPIGAACLLLVLVPETVAQRDTEPAAAARIAAGLAGGAIGLAIAQAFKHRHAAGGKSVPAPAAPPVDDHASRDVGATPPLHPLTSEYRSSEPDYVEDVSGGRYEGALSPEIADLLDRLRAWEGQVDGDFGLEESYRRGLVSRTDLTEALWHLFCIHVAVLSGSIGFDRAEILGLSDRGDIPRVPIGWTQGGWKVLSEPSGPHTTLFQSPSEGRPHDD